jgi:hypothetical protein
VTTAYSDLTGEDVAAVATAARISTTVRNVAGDPISIGPLQVGPGRVARATATGRVRDCTALRDDTDGLVSYLTVLDLRLDLDVLAAGRHHRFDVELAVRLRITAVSACKQQIRTSVTPPAPDDVTVVLRPRGLQARLLATVGGVEQTVRQEAAAYIAARLDQEDTKAAMLLHTADTDRRTSA